MRNAFQKFVISQVAILIRDNKCLILEFNNLKTGKPSGTWGLPGGRIDEGELAEPAFSRELKEEIKIDDFKFLETVAYDIWYRNDNSEGMCAIANLIENETDEIKLSFEHAQYKWVTEKELDDYNFVWPNAKKLIKEGFKAHKKYSK